MKNRLQAIALFSAILLAFPGCRQEQEQKTVSSTTKTETAEKAKPAGDSLARFEFATEACDNTGFYEQDKFTAEQLQHTYNLLMLRYPVFETKEILERPEDTNPEKVAQAIKQLDQEYAGLKKKFESAEIVAVPFWENIKKLRLLELQELYELKKLTLQAHTNPQILANSPFAKACPEYVNALAATDTAGLFRGRRKLLKETQKQNGAPNNLAKRYKEAYHSPDRIFLARKELLEYGWWNCANDQRKYGETENQYPLAKEFEKLFVKIKSDCAEMD
jgi:hypothetical protein